MPGPLPDSARIEPLLEALDEVSSLPGTLEIHDPLYALSRSPSDVDLRALAIALARHPDHPLTERVRACFGDALTVAPRTLEDVLRLHGPLAEGTDPVEEVERRLARAGEVERVLRARIADVEAADRLLVRNANLLAAAGALIAIFALIGWLIALGEWDIDWMEPPEPPDEPAAPERAP